MDNSRTREDAVCIAISSYQVVLSIPVKGGDCTKTLVDIGVDESKYDFGWKRDRTRWSEN